MCTPQACMCACVPVCLRVLLALSLLLTRYGLWTQKDLGEINEENHILLFLYSPFTQPLHQWFWFSNCGVIFRGWMTFPQGSHSRYPAYQTFTLWFIPVAKSQLGSSSTHVFMVGGHHSTGSCLKGSEQWGQMRTTVVQLSFLPSTRAQSLEGHALEQSLLCFQWLILSHTDFS